MPLEITLMELGKVTNNRKRLSDDEDDVFKERVRGIALANGFKLKEQPDGTMDLNPYVYDFAKALLREMDKL